MNGLLSALAELIANPGTNPRALIILVTIATLVLLILVILVLLVVMKRRSDAQAWAEWDEYEEWEDGEWDDEAIDETPSDPDLEPLDFRAIEYEYPELAAELFPAAADATRAESRWRRVLRVGGGWLAGALVVIAVLVGYDTLGSTETCRNACHALDKAAVMHARDAHSAVDCVRCHEDPPPLGIPGAAVQRAAHILQPYLPGLHVYAGPVGADRCLSCHAKVGTDEVIANDAGVRMSHKQPLAAGMSCDDCHRLAGHKDTPRGVPMTACMNCHDGQRASSRCDYCHTKDVGLLSKNADRMTSRSRLPIKAQCGSCHDQKPCDTCHGLRLPHTDVFKAYGHGYAAAFQKKSVCERCHQPSACNRCHGQFSGPSFPHGADWRQVHTGNAWNAECSCHIQRLPVVLRARGSYCLTCHPAGRPGGEPAPAKPVTTKPPAASPSTPTP